MENENARSGASPLWLVAAMIVIFLIFFRGPNGLIHKYVLPSVNTASERAFWIALAGGDEVRTPAEKDTKSRVPADSGTERIRGRLDAVWEEPDSRILHTIRRQGKGYTVASSVGSDGEVFDVSNVMWKDGVLQWTVRAPSTAYVVRYRTLALRGGALEYSWSGTAGSGKETLRKR